MPSPTEYKGLQALSPLISQRHRPFPFILTYRRQSASINGVVMSRFSQGEYDHSFALRQIRGVTYSDPLTVNDLLITTTSPKLEQAPVRRPLSWSQI